MQALSLLVESGVPQHKHVPPNVGSYRDAMRDKRECAHHGKRELSSKKTNSFVRPSSLYQSNYRYSIGEATIVVHLWISVSDVESDIV
jgi:hypothetical protein